MEKHSEESSDPLLRQSAEEESSIYSTSNPPSDFGDGRRRIYAWLREHAVSIATISLLFYIAVALTVDIAIRAAQQPPEPLGKIISTYLGISMSESFEVLLTILERPSERQPTIRGEEGVVSPRCPMDSRTLG